MDIKTIKRALISVFDKNGIEEIVKELDNNNVEIISTGGTKSYIEGLGVSVTSVESLTGYPSFLDGRVKTLHPKIFGALLCRSNSDKDAREIQEMDIKPIDLVIVDLYPFEQTVKTTTDESEIIEKIDIGGISLIRAAAKNYADVITVSGQAYYDKFLQLIKENKCSTTLNERKEFAKLSFAVSSNYDTAIYNYFKTDDLETFRYSEDKKMDLRYGENPHQQGKFFGDFDELFNQLHGKKISYNNLLDISSAVDLISEFTETTIAILKHTNACGLASRDSLTEAWKDALAGDPLSAFGGIIISNREIDEATATEIDKIFYEVVIAPAYSKKAFEILSQKKNRIILVQKLELKPSLQFRSVLNGVLAQEKNTKKTEEKDFEYVTKQKPTQSEIEDLIFANKIVKNSKSNTIVLAKNKQLIGSGVGETSRVDALRHAIEKAKSFKLDLSSAVMSSDAFFPFADSVELAHSAGICSVIQPGGSIKDKDSIKYCDENNMSMVFTGSRHFKH